MTMKSLILVSLLSLGGVGMVGGQVTQDPTTGAFICSTPEGNYCAGESLSTNIIFRCSNGTGQPGNCNDNLAGVPPVGVKPFAPCYESSPTAGDAQCSFNCVVYAPNGTFPVPDCTPTDSSTTTITTSGGTAGPTDTGKPLYPTGKNNTVTPTATGVSPPTVSPTDYVSAATVRRAGGMILAVGLVVVMALV